MTPFEQQNYYEILEVPPSATDADIRAAYERLMELYAPDSVAIYALADPGQVDALRARMTEAMEILTEPDLRVEYDQSIGVTTERLARASGAASPPQEVSGATVRAVEALASAAEALASVAEAEASGSVKAPAATGSVVPAPALTPSASRPVAASPEPVPSAPEPVAAAPQAVASTPEPVPSAPEPVAASAEPAPSTSQPMAASPEPAPSQPTPSAPQPAPMVGGAVLEAFRSSFSQSLSFVYVPAAFPAPVANTVMASLAQPAPLPAREEQGRAAPTPESMPAEPVREAPAPQLPAPVQAGATPELTPTLPDEAPEPVPVPEPVEPARAEPPAVPAPPPSTPVPEEPERTPPAREAAPAPAAEPPAALARVTPPVSSRPPPPLPPQVRVTSRPAPGTSSEPVAPVGPGAPASRGMPGRQLGEAPLLAQDSAIATAESALAQVAARVRDARPRGIDIPPDAEFNGELLRRVREARGLTIQALADRTRISVRHLENVEADRYGSLPTTVYLRGILMNLARELGLDPLRVSKSYLTLTSEKPGKGAR